MKKRTIITLVIVVLALSLILYLLTMTGFASKNWGTCSDTDGGDNKFVKGITSYSNRDISYTDYCLAKETKEKDWLKEYYCLYGNFRIRSVQYKCENGCKDGACIK